jgi:hypothetical protein
MNMQVDVELQGDLLLAMARGTLSFDAALGVWKQILEAAEGHHVNRILVDVTAVDGTLSVTEGYPSRDRVIATCNGGRDNCGGRAVSHLGGIRPNRCSESRKTGYDVPKPA